MERRRLIPQPAKRLHGMFESFDSETTAKLAHGSRLPRRALTPVRLAIRYAIRVVTAAGSLPLGRSDTRIDRVRLTKDPS